MKPFFIECRKILPVGRKPEFFWEPWPGKENPKRYAKSAYARYMAKTLQKEGYMVRIVQLWQGHRKTIIEV